MFTVIVKYEAHKLFAQKGIVFIELLLHLNNIFSVTVQVLFQ